MATIVYIAETMFGSAWYRCHTPGMALKELGHEVVLTRDPDPALLERCDVLVLLHLARPGIDRLVGQLDARGTLTVFDIDDDYWNLHPENQANRYWDAERLRIMEQVARACRVVTVSTPELADVMKPMNPNVRVLRNMLPDAHWPTTRRPVSETGPLVLGWAGSSSHLPDVRMVAPVLLQLLDEYPDLTVRLVGANPDWVTSHPRLEIGEWVQIEEYPAQLAGFDIAIAPLLDTRFNRCKSDLKYVECAMAGLPVVASQVDSYTAAIVQGENGFLARNTKDWLKHLRRLIEDSSLRDRIGEAARPFAEERLVSANAWRWEKTYGLPDSRETP